MQFVKELMTRRTKSTEITFPPSPSASPVVLADLVAGRALDVASIMWLPCLRTAYLYHAKGWRHGQGHIGDGQLIVQPSSRGEPILTLTKGWLLCLRAISVTLYCVHGSGTEAIRVHHSKFCACT
eukprot:1818272-Amphidinium_carterae.1